MSQPERLDALLSEWTPLPSDQPGFAAGVQRRVNQTRAKTRWTRIVQFPATLPLAAGFAVMLGVTAALASHRAEMREERAEAYLRTIDPIRMTAHHSH